MVSIHPPISNSFRHLMKSLGTIPSVPIIIGITVTLIFYSFLSSLAGLLLLLLYRLIGLVGRVFTNGPGDLGSIPSHVIPKTLKMVLDAPCLTLSIIMYGSRVKWSNPGKGVVPSPTPWCSSYWKGSLLVTLNNGLQLYLLLLLLLFFSFTFSSLQSFIGSLSLILGEGR